MVDHIILRVNENQVEIVEMIFIANVINKVMIVHIYPILDVNKVIRILNLFIINEVIDLSKQLNHKEPLVDLLNITNFKVNVVIIEIYED